MSESLPIPTQKSEQDIALIEGALDLNRDVEVLRAGLMSRRRFGVAFLTLGGAALVDRSQVFAAPPPRQVDTAPQSKAERLIRSFTAQIAAREGVLQNGSADAVRALIFSDPDIGARASLPPDVVRRVFPKISLTNGYISPEDARQKGEFSIPAIPGFLNVDAFNPSVELPTSEHLKESPRKAFYGRAFANTIRVTGGKLLLPGAFYEFKDPSFGEALLGGRQLEALTVDLGKRYQHAGELEFDVERARQAHGTWASLMWLHNQRISETTVDDPARPNLLWAPHMEGGWVYSLSRSPALKQLIERQIRSDFDIDHPLYKMQEARMLASLPNA